METIGSIGVYIGIWVYMLGLYWDNGESNGKENGKFIGNLSLGIILGHIAVYSGIVDNRMETTIYGLRFRV